MAARKLRERLGMVGPDLPVEPEIKVPPADKMAALVEEAASGFAAVQALYADRNCTAALAADLNQKVNVLQAIITQLREDLRFEKQRNEFLMQGFARQGAYLSQAGDLFRRINTETHQVNAVIEQIPRPVPASNNPQLPKVNTIGLPIQEEPDEQLEPPQFDDTGLPYNTANDGPPPPDAAELYRLVNRINGIDRQS